MNNSSKKFRAIENSKILEYLKKHDSEANSYLLLNKEFSIFELPSKGIVGYQIFNKKVYALGGLIGDNPRELLQKFLKNFSDKEVLFVSISEKDIPLLIDHGFKVNGLELNGKIILKDFNLDGRKKKKLRSKYNIISKILDFRELTNITDEEKKQINRINVDWLRSQRLINKKELTFLNEKFSFENLSNRRLFVAQEKTTGKIVAFYVICPMFFKKGYETQTYRAAPDCTIAGLNHFAFVKLIYQLRDEGFKELSLGQTLFKDINSYARNDNRFVKAFFNFIYNRGGKFINHRNLFRFKDQLFPVWEKRYLCGKPKLGIKHIIDLLRLTNKI